MVWFHDAESVPAKDIARIDFRTTDKLNMGL